MSAFRVVCWKNDKQTAANQPAAQGHVQLPISVVREIGRALKEGELQPHLEHDERNDNEAYVKLKVSLWKVEQKSDKSPLLSGEINSWSEQKAMYAAADAKKSGVSTDDDFNDLGF